MSWHHLIAALVPPPDADEASVNRWRSMMAAAVLMLIVVQGLNISLSKGWIGTWAYATESDVESLSGQVRRQVLRTLESEILTLRERQCLAIENTNLDAARFASEALQKRRGDFHDLTGRPYPMPTCREVGVPVLTRATSQDD